MGKSRNTVLDNYSRAQLREVCVGAMVQAVGEAEVANKLQNHSRYQYKKNDWEEIYECMRKAHQDLLTYPNYSYMHANFFEALFSALNYLDYKDTQVEKKSKGKNTRHKDSDKRLDSIVFFLDSATFYLPNESKLKERLPNNSPPALRIVNLIQNLQGSRVDNLRALGEQFNQSMANPDESLKALLERLDSLKKQSGYWIKHQWTSTYSESARKAIESYQKGKLNNPIENVIDSTKPSSSRVSLFKRTNQVLKDINNHGEAVFEASSNFLQQSKAFVALNKHLMVLTNDKRWHLFRMDKHKELGQFLDLFCQAKSVLEMKRIMNAFEAEDVYEGVDMKGFKKLFNKGQGATTRIFGLNTTTTKCIQDFAREISELVDESTKISSLGYTE